MATAASAEHGTAHLSCPLPLPAGSLQHSECCSQQIVPPSRTHMPSPRSEAGGGDGALAAGVVAEGDANHGLDNGDGWIRDHGHVTHLPFHYRTRPAAVRRFFTARADDGRDGKIYARAVAVLTERIQVLWGSCAAWAAVKGMRGRQLVPPSVPGRLRRTGMSKRSVHIMQA